MSVCVYIRMCVSSCVRPMHASAFGGQQIRSPGAGLAARCGCWRRTLGPLQKKLLTAEWSSYK